MNRILTSLASVLLLAAPARAGIIYSGVQNIPIPLTPGGVYLNIVTGATASSEPGDWNSAPWMNPFWGGVDFSNDDLFRPVIDAPTSLIDPDTMVNLAFGTLIDSSLNFTGGENVSSGHTSAVATMNKFTLGTPGYIGFAFSPTVGGPTEYGWAQVIFDNTGSDAKIIDWAYDDTPGTPLGAGVSAVPEPGTALFGAAMLLGAACRRKRWSRGVAANRSGADVR